MAPFRNDYAIMTSCDVMPHDAEVKGNIFRHAIYRLTLVATAFTFLELRRGGNPPPPGRRR